MGWGSYLEDNIEKNDGIPSPPKRTPSHSTLLQWDGRSTARRATPVKCQLCEISIDPRELRRHVRYVHGELALILLPLRKFLNHR